MNRKDKAKLAKDLLLDRSCNNCGKSYTSISKFDFVKFRLFCGESANRPKENICAKWDDEPKIDICDNCVYYKDAWCYFRQNLKPTPDKNTCGNWEG